MFRKREFCSRFIRYTPPLILQIKKYIKTNIHVVAPIVHVPNEEEGEPEK